MKKITSLLEKYNLLIEKITIFTANKYKSSFDEKSHIRIFTDKYEIKSYVDDKITVRRIDASLKIFSGLRPSSTNIVVDLIIDAATNTNSVKEIKNTESKKNVLVPNKEITEIALALDLASKRNSSSILLDSKLDHNYFLEIFINNEDGVALPTSCEEVNEKIENMILIT